MRFRAGLTLLETLAATVLLTMIAIACVPLLQQTTSHRKSDAEDMATNRLLSPESDLSRITDAIIRQPSIVSAKSMEDLLSQSSVVIAWPPAKPSNASELSAESHGMTISLRVMRRVQPVPDDQEDSVWIEFSIGEKERCVRWVAIPARTTISGARAKDAS